MVDIINLIDILRITILFPVFAYASYKDYNNREINPKIWAPIILSGTVLILFEAILSDAFMTIISFSTAVASVGLVSYLILKMGLFKRGDFKALLSLSILVPLRPKFFGLPYYDPSSSIISMTGVMESSSIVQFVDLISIFIFTEVFGLSVIINAGLISSFYFFVVGYNNKKNGDFDINRPLRSFTAKSVEVSNIPDEKGSILEKTTKEKRVKRGFEFIKNGLGGLSSRFFRDYVEWMNNNNKISPRDISQIDDIEMNKFLADTDWTSDTPQEDKKEILNIIDDDSVWMTPGIPFVGSITFGTLVSIITGNLIYTIIILIS